MQRAPGSPQRGVLRGPATFELGGGKRLREQRLPEKIAKLTAVELIERRDDPEFGHGVKPGDPRDIGRNGTQLGPFTACSARRSGKPRVGPDSTGRRQLACGSAERK